MHKNILWCFILYHFLKYFCLIQLCFYAQTLFLQDEFIRILLRLLKFNKYILSCGKLHSDSKQIIGSFLCTQSLFLFEPFQAEYISDHFWGEFSTDERFEQVSKYLWDNSDLCRPQDSDSQLAPGKDKVSTKSLFFLKSYIWHCTTYLILKFDFFCHSLLMAGLGCQKQHRQNHLDCTLASNSVPVSLAHCVTDTEPPSTMDLKSVRERERERERDHRVRVKNEKLLSYWIFGISKQHLPP